MIDDTSNGCGFPPAPSVHPAEWIFLGLAIACLLWVAAEVLAIGKTSGAVPECAVPVPPTTIKPQELRT